MQVTFSGKKNQDKRDKAEERAKALRENLLKRKNQVRQRKTKDASTVTVRLNQDKPKDTEDSKAKKSP